jgi:hypothetical protein
MHRGVRPLGAGEPQRAGQARADHVELRVVDEEHERGEQDADRDRLQEADGRGRHDDQQDDGEVLERQPAPLDPEPFVEEVETEIDKHRREDAERQHPEILRAREERGCREGGDAAADPAGVGAGQPPCEQRGADDVIAEQPPAPAGDEVRDAERAQVPVDVDALARGELEPRGVEDRADQREADEREDRRGLDEDLAIFGLREDCGRQPPPAAPGGLEGPEQKPHLAGPREVDPRERDQAVERREAAGEHQRQREAVAGPPRDHEHRDAEQHRWAPAQQRPGRQEARAFGHGGHEHGEAALRDQVARRGEKAAEHRIGDEAREKPEPGDADDQERDAGGEPGDGDQHRHRREQHRRIAARQPFGDGEGAEREDHRGQVLRLGDRAAIGAAERRDQAERDPAEEADADAAVEKVRQRAGKDDRRKGDRHHEGQRPDHRHAEHEAERLPERRHPLRGRLRLRHRLTPCRFRL